MPMTMMRHLFLTLALLLSTAQAQAACVPIACSCGVSTTNVAFGSYNPFDYGNTDSTGSVKVSCGGLVGLLIPYDIKLSSGGGSFASRRMSSGANTLSYNLYTSAAYTSVWGDGTGATSIVSSGILLDVGGLAPPQTHWVYGRLPGRQTTAVPGTYVDSINVTLIYY